MISGQPDNRWRVLSLSISGGRGSKGLSPGFQVGDSVDDSLLESGRERIRQALYNRGFLSAEVELETAIDQKGIRVAYRLSRLILTKIGGWQFAGNESLSEKELQAVMPGKGRGWSAGVLTHAEKMLLNAYARSGFAFAEVQCAGVKESAGTVIPVFNINEGPRVKIGFLTFSGAVFRSDKYQSLLRRYAGFRPDLYYSPERVKTWCRNLKRGGWITVDSEEIVLSPGGYGIRFWVSERRSGEVYGVVGYAPEQRQLMGYAQVQLFNLLHTGRKVKARWYSAYRETRYQLEYTEPWVFHSPLSLSAGFEQNVFDTSYAQTTISLTGRVVNDATEFSLGSGIDRTVGRNLQQKLWLRTGMLFDSRDQPVFPRQGVNFRIDTRAGEQRVQDDGRGVIGWFESDLEPVIAIYRGLIWVNNISLRAVFSELSLNEPDLYRVGGMQNIRGYREASFSARRLGWWNCEWRYQFSGNARLHCFFDAGLFSQPEALGWSWLSGYGVGGRWRTRLGLVGVDYGVPLTENPLHGKIHLSLTTEF